MAVLLFVPLFSSAQTPSAAPLVIVNGRITDLPDLKGIEPQEIEKIDIERADEANIAKYGERANNGIILVTLKYDEAPHFTVDGTTFDDYVAARVKWSDNDPAARVAIRYTIGEEGRITLGEVLEATDKRLLRRVREVAAEAVETALWQPARKNGTPVATEKVLKIQLPHGKPMPAEPYIVIL